MTMLGQNGGYFLCAGLAIVAIAQWVIVVGIAYKKGVIFDLDKYPGLFGDDTRKVALRDDRFFILWNLLPIFLVGNLFYLLLNWSAWREDLLALAPEVKPATIGAIAWHWHSVPIIALCLVVALVFGWFQLKKIENMEKDGRKSNLYWWDSRISRSIAYTRLFSLAVNMVSVTYVLCMSLIMSGYLLRLVFRDDLNLNLFHPDGACGLLVVGRISILIGSVFMFFFICGIAGLLDHVKGDQHWSHRYFDRGMVSSVIVVAVMILVPASRCKILIDDFMEIPSAEAIAVLEAAHQEYFGLDSDERADVEVREISDWMESRSGAIAVAQRITDTRSWVIDFAGIVGVLTVWIIPCLGWVLENVIKKKMTKTKGEE